MDADKPMYLFSKLIEAVFATALVVLNSLKEVLNSAAVAQLSDTVRQQSWVASPTIPVSDRGTPLHHVLLSGVHELGISLTEIVLCALKEAPCL